MKKGYKLCPYCANEIKEKATKCQFCKEFLNKEKMENEKDPQKDKNGSQIIDDKKEIISEEDNKSKELKKANQNIKTAFIFGCLGGGLTLIQAISQFSDGNFSLLYGLIYRGILLFFLYKKNRIAAIFLFIEYVLDTIYAFMVGGATGVLGILILVALFVGILGTFSYHKIMNETEMTRTDIILLIVCSLLTVIAIIGVISVL